jgi:hypothetical protein
MENLGSIEMIESDANFYKGSLSTTVFLWWVFVRFENNSGAWTSVMGGTIILPANFSVLFCISSKIQNLLNKDYLSRFSVNILYWKETRQGCVHITYFV